MNQESGKGIIFGVLGILTLIIAIMGASLAYFTANAMSGDEPIEVTAATVTISYIQGEILYANELIPATSNVVDWSYNRTDVDESTGESLQCKDDLGYQVCSIFRFDASNESGRNDQRIIGSITTTTDVVALGQEREFRNLSYTVYDVSEDGTRTKINPELTKLASAGGKTQLFNSGAETGANEYLVEAGSIHHFEIVVWLNEQSTDLENDDGSGNQDDEQGLSYSGIVEIGISNASDKVTGTIGD